MGRGKTVGGIRFQPRGLAWVSLGGRLRVFRAGPVATTFFAIVDGHSIVGRDPRQVRRFLTSDAAMHAAVSMLRKLDKDAAKRLEETP
jgi:hypothetical protein